MTLFALAGVAVVASVIGIGFLCALVSPAFITLAVLEGLCLGWLAREMYC